MATTELPVNIERQLLALDRQIRDVAFGRGLSRLILWASLSLAAFLAADWSFGLNGGIRSAFLTIWALGTVFVAWRQVLGSMWRPPSLAELAALAERQHPELKERLTSLVELRDRDAAPGASRLMRDILVRQTAKAVERLDLSDSSAITRSPGLAFASVMALLLLLAPFVFFPSDYQLLWARLFAPWGNFNWGSLELVVVDGDRVVARGSDVTVQIEARQRSRHTSAPKAEQLQIWVHWTDLAGVSDWRRLEWDAEARRFATTLPHIFQSLTLYAATSGARSEQHRIDVADAPAISRLQLDIESPSYTGLPARTLDGAQGEIRVTERSRIVMKLDFNEPVTAAELLWPIPADTTSDATTDGPRPTQRTIRAKLSANGLSATTEALAISSGTFAIQLRNKHGLTNDDPHRALVVDPDLPPAISLEGSDEPVAVRPDDRYLVKAMLRDDFGLTAVELRLETSLGQKRMDVVPADRLRERAFTHQFLVDLGDFELKPGNAVTYRVHAVDNRPIPQPQETWTKPRTLMIESKASPPPDPDLAEHEQDIKEQLAAVRQDLGKTKEELEKLHQQTEQEALKQQNSDKSDQLAKLEQQQADLQEKLEQIAAELGERQLTEKLGQQAQQLAQQDLAEAQQRIQDAKTGEARDQLQPISEAIDKLAAVDKQLRALEQQLAELNRLEQDLAQLDRLARNSERLADKLDQLDQQAQQPANPAANDDPASKPDANQPNDKPAGDTPPAAANAASPKQNDPAELEAQRKKLQAEGQMISQELADLLKKHPELLDAARRDQQQQLNDLADQARELAKPQQDLAKSFKQAADEAAKTAPKSEQGPVDAAQPNDKPDAAPKSPDNDSKPAQSTEPQAADKVPADDPNTPPAQSEEKQTTDSEAAAQAVKDQQQLAQEAARQALETAQKEGLESKATQAATDFARQAAEAARKAQTGDLNEAGQQGKAAAQSAQQAAQELKEGGQPESPQAKLADDLAQRQQQLANQLQQLAPSKQAQQGAQQQGQQQLADATQALSKQLEQAAKNLQSSPLDAPKQADAASQAQQSATQAQQAMQQAAGAAKSNDATTAAEQSAVAAEKLQQAAQQAQTAASSSSSNSAVPEKVGTKVAQASQQLQEAQKQLGSPNQGQPGTSAAPPPGRGSSSSNSPVPGTGQRGSNPGGDESAQPGSPESNGAQPAPSDQPGGPAEQNTDKASPQNAPTGNAEPKEKAAPSSSPDAAASPQGEPSLANAAEKFRQAAAALRRAIPGDGDQPSDQTGKPALAQNQDPMGEPNESTEPGGPGGSNPNSSAKPGDEDLKKLDTELKKQAQRNWGRLPGQLKTEITQGATKKPRPEYARQIKSYFEEIAKPATKENPKSE